MLHASADNTIDSQVRMYEPTHTTNRRERKTSKARRLPRALAESSTARLCWPAPGGGAVRHSKEVSAAARTDGDGGQREQWRHPQPEPEWRSSLRSTRPPGCSRGDLFAVRPSRASADPTPSLARTDHAAAGLAAADAAQLSKESSSRERTREEGNKKRTG